MNRIAMRTALPLITAGAVLLAGAGASAAAPLDEPIPADGAEIVLNDGRVVGVDDTVTFTFEGEEPKARKGDMGAAACPEVNSRPTYTVKGSPYFIADKNKPQSTWLLPRQTVSWAVTGSHTFTWDIGASAEAEAGAILAKAKVSVDTKISNSWTWTGTQTVTDTNTTSKGYRAVLGQVGWKLTGVKTWIAPPCNVKKKTIVILAPRKGDMSIGRQNS
ncbi:hypothetical protein Q5762_35270 [Streptomyces sp. P9(2023)]|uniref:hypothetical protein n=1 Tax=Streptomyces sp. P9(2023) TaxID=3064394 RepID=UPI0028F43DD5|nr:hypothetical protein [Streptomyces sp. P9(2023)]MDT9693494.1 hypothetical protein [Streptomyces sp. P9(2023)]